MKARDIAGIVIGVPVFLLGLYVGLGALHLGLYFGLVSATLLFVSVGLFIPSRRYEHGIARAIGFVALSLATALTVGCVAGFGLNLHDSFHEVAGDDATALLAIAVGCHGFRVLMLGDMGVTDEAQSETGPFNSCHCGGHSCRGTGRGVLCRLALIGTTPAAGRFVGSRNGGSADPSLHPERFVLRNA